VVRASAAEMLKLFGGSYPPPHDATSFGNFAAQADAVLDTFALPAALSTTGTNEVALANRVAANLVLRALWASAGGVLSGKPEPVVLSNDMKDEVRQLLYDSTVDGFTTLDMLDEDA
jgi:hypothetical protein